MTAYTRRIFGTIFVCLLAFLELATYLFLVGYLTISTGQPINIYAAILASIMFIVLPVKFLMHLAILSDPDFTAGSGNPQRLNAFLLGTAICNAAAYIFLCDKKLLYDPMFYAVPLPTIIAIFERIAYSTADDSNNCLKYFKPFAVAAEEPTL